MLNKTMDYLDNFARFQKKENVEAVERLLSAHKEFHKFERAQLGKLICGEASRATPAPLTRESAALVACDPGF